MSAPTTRRLPRGPRSILGTALVAVASATSLLALGGLLEPGRWRGVAWLSIAVLAAVIATVRALTRSWWAPTLAGLVVAGAGLVLRYGSPPGRLQVLPDLAALDRTLAAFREGMTLINTSTVPMTVVRPTELIIVTGALAVLVLADLLAVGLGLAAWSGLPLLGMWAPAVLLGFPGDVWPLAWTALTYLLLLALSAAPPGARSDRTRRASVAVVSAAAVVTLTLVAGPVVAALPGWSSVQVPGLGTGAVGPLRLSEDLDLRESLGDRSGQPVLRYTVTDAEAPVDADDDPLAAATPAGPTVSARLVGPLRAFTVADFDGRSWQRADAEELVDWDPSLLLSSDPSLLLTAPDPDAGVLAQVDVEVANLREDHLPVATFARTVVADGSWLYDQRRDEVVGSRATRPGMSYQMLVQVPDLTADDLRDAPVGRFDGVEQYLALPETDHTDDIAALAREVAAEATTPYEQSLALQTWFRSTQNFTYDARVAAARTDDAVWDFLSSRRGYCVQFATSMAVMARSMGIPARVGVGFLPGTSQGDGTYTVTGRQAHAWPELFFEGAGWVRFEPTPAVQTGTPPQWSDPLLDAGAGATRPDSEQIPTAAAPGASATAPAGAPVGPREQTEESSFPTLGIALGAAVVLVAAGLSVVLVRRRSTHRGELVPERAWRRLRDRLGARGLDWSDSTTPRAAVDTLQGMLRDRTGADLDGSALTALQALAQAVEQERYAPTWRGVRGDELERWVVEVTEGVSRLLSDRTRRGAVPSAPRTAP
ncbi:transglutaminaseTgpA domain-containing protein [Cellulomonas soli]|uniref:transglutaminase family protein n=1 Tax=Cellulomonas soli TaxID=931535 RepID=UPI003F825A96